jgi:hypothetical protein
MTELDRLVEKHRANGLLIDSNLFLLYLVGNTNELRIPKFDRTQRYTIPEFRLLGRLVAQFRKVITTPHVLTEVSNLARLNGAELLKLRAKFNEIVQATSEFYEESRTIMASSLFAKFGLTDAAIGILSQRPMLVLTDDLQLYTTLTNRGVDAINFNHIRTYAW